MNENLRKSIFLYAIGEEGELEDFLRGLSKNTLEALFVVNDKNSSKLRELSAIYIAGYETIQKNWDITVICS